ncbi:MAG TPA: hypothetical protein VGP55_05190 [Chitinophagaceae bacterium]|nr:hypothetical protein [Chitinophagaceae bacterium]
MTIKENFSHFYKYAFVPAILYCIPVLFFIKEDTYRDTWLLYLGNGIFLACLFILKVIYNSKRNTNVSIAYNGWVVTFIGIIFSCMLIVGLLILFVPRANHINSMREALQQTPAAISNRNMYGLWFILFASAIIGNFCAGAFATLIAKGALAKDPA